MRNNIARIKARGMQAMHFALKKTDLPLLFFLLLMMNYRYSFKIAALVGIYLYRPDLKIRRDGIFWFYTGMMGLGIVNLLFISRDYSLPHILVMLAGCLTWLACLLSFHQVRLSVETREPYKILNTLKLLTIVNFLVSAYDFLKIVCITHTINPFTQISSPPYGISSGDLIGGVFGGMHLVNTITCCLLAIFFIYRGLFGYVLLCLIPFLLTGSNLGTLILAGMLLYIVFLKVGAVYKGYALGCLAFIALFYIKITPDNQKYMVKVINKAGKQFSPPAKKAAPGAMDSITPVKPVKAPPTKEELIASYIRYMQKRDRMVKLPVEKKPADSLLTAMYNYEKHKKAEEEIITGAVFNRKDSLARAKLHSPFYEYGQLKKFDLESEAGKTTSFKQTAAYLRQNPANAVFGAGIGSFSSRLAFITSGIVEDSRVLMALPHYETKAFRENHKAIFKYLMFRDDETHSITNLPFCWYNQVLGEYGLLGFLIFVVFYCGYFLKRFSLIGFGRILLLAMLGFFFFDYWYERLSVIIIFELLMLLDIKTKQAKNDDAWNCP